MEKPNRLSSPRRGLGGTARRPASKSRSASRVTASRVAAEDIEGSGAGEGRTGGGSWTGGDPRGAPPGAPVERDARGGDTRVTEATGSASLA